MSTITVTTWSLRQTSPADLRPAAEPGAGVRVVRAEVPSPEFSRFLYTAVGGDVRWTDRLGLGYEEWRALVSAPGVETWVAYEDGTPAGYAELAADGDGTVEIVYFGLLPAFRGRGIGGHLLTCAARRAWDLAGRWPGVSPTRTVWLHTCSKDGPHAMDNYLRRGFALFGTETAQEPEAAAPGPWPGAVAIPGTES
ncbi:GNAT family N-acetyltransferase [Streptomyces fuscigenes]|uniref:GNAT family N-acetyltransferase n=1 Tax=Streptomyces fuscigenes TaxID=1528880 RepID=UPI001F29487D|nr:GNAT family N-acetyltransferase [Streptomyces fuscigenes]MCF3961309.1 GNAT family N-acetyltransferase [Streptomyces fuscigenes]